MACAIVHLMELSGRSILDIFVLEVRDDEFASFCFPVFLRKINGQVQFMIQPCDQVGDMLT